MNRNTLYKTIISLSHIVVLLSFIALTILGYYDTRITLSPILILYSSLELAITVFAVFYTMKLSENIDRSLPFMSLYLFSFQLAVITIADTDSTIASILPISSITISAFLVYCAIVMNLMLTGYGLFSRNKSKVSVKSFLFVSIVTSISIAHLIPKMQGVFDFWNDLSILGTFSIFSVVNVVTFTTLLITDPPGSQGIRNITGFILSVFTWLFFSFKAFIPALVSVMFLTISLILISIFCIHYSIKL